jgi:AMP nucleosidase
VLFTNYQFYIDEFVKLGRSLMDETPGSGADVDGFHDAGFLAFVEPGNLVTHRRGASGAAPAPPTTELILRIYTSRRDASAGQRRINVKG